MSELTELALTDGVLDLRPSKDSVIYQLLRLGLTFDHRDVSGETWTDYTNGVIATFENNQQTDVIFSDQAQEINQLNLSASQCQQNAYLISQLRPNPVPAFQVANPFASMYTGCCNNNVAI